MTGMKRTTIKTILRKKLNYWLDSITDERVREIARENVLVCGGAISSMLLGEKPNDYDLYFKTKGAAMAVAVYYIKVFNASNKLSSVNGYEAELREIKVTNIRGEEEERIVIFMKSAGVAAEDQNRYEYFEGQSEATTTDFIKSLKTQDDIGVQLGLDPAETVEDVSKKLKSEKVRYRPIFLTDNAITLSDKVQVIIRFFGSVDDIHNNFDFVHAFCSYDLAGNSLTLPAESLEALLTRNLIYKGSLYPIASLFRIRKFLERGFRISAGQLLKIVWQLNELDLTNLATLKEQLIGVDFAYMRELIAALEKDAGALQIDSIYIGQLIDEIFE
jgi:hypothetical protein